jgi:hypothetical protein
VAAFHKAVAAGDVTQPTVAPSVQSTMVTLLGRTAAYEKRLVTWDELVADRQRLIPDLEGLRT